MLYFCQPSVSNLLFSPMQVKECEINKLFLQMGSRRSPAESVMDVVRLSARNTKKLSDSSGGIIAFATGVSLTD